MTQPPNDDGIQGLFRALKQEDAAQAPTFEATMRKAAERRPWWRTPAIPIGLGLVLSGATAAAAVVLMITFDSAPQVTAVGLAQSTTQPEPLASLLQRPGDGSSMKFGEDPIPKRRLLGGWE
jgi:hypothetical protein